MSWFWSCPVKPENTWASHGRFVLEVLRKRHSLSWPRAHVWSGHLQSVLSPTHNLSVSPGNAECHESPGPCDGKPSSSRAPESCHTCTYTKARAVVGHLYPAIAEGPLLQAIALVRLTAAPCTGSSVEDLPQAIRTEDPSDVVGFNESFNSPKNHGTATITLNCPPHPLYMPTGSQYSFWSLIQNIMTWIWIKIKA